MPTRGPTTAPEAGLTPAVRRPAARLTYTTRTTARAVARAALAAALAACGGGGGNGRTVAEPPPVVTPPSATQYQNPVLDADFPDPAVVRAPDGAYYAYATQTTGLRVQVSRSADLVAWSAATEGMPAKPVWTSAGSNYFAPDVAYRDGRYVMYYSAQIDPTRRTNANDDFCIGMAESAAPTGPFTDLGNPLVCGPGFQVIDPQGFDDPQTGRRYLYWGSNSQPLVVRELAADRRTFAAGSQTVSLVSPRAGNYLSAYDVDLIEGPWVTYNAPYYYLYFSGNRCCAAEAHYAVMVARASSPAGPFEVRRSGEAAFPILQGAGVWENPGHNAVVRDGAGAEWMLYHAINASNRFLLPGRTDISRRPMLLDRITYTDGWPVVGGAGTPTTTAQARPTP